MCFMAGGAAGGPPPGPAEEGAARRKAHFGQARRRTDTFRRPVRIASGEKPPREDRTLLARAFTAWFSQRVLQNAQLFTMPSQNDATTKSSATFFAGLSWQTDYDFYEQHF